MTKANAENERVKREYLIWLKEARGRSEATLDIAAAAIDRFQAQTRHRDFRKFRPELATSFKVHMAVETSSVTGKPLSKATLYSTLKAVQSFFEWLSREPGYRQAVRISDVAYFTMNSNDAKAATATREQPFPSLKQVLHVLEIMPTDTALARRDRALLAFILLTGVRDAAAISLKLRHVELSRRRVVQDARDVRTKGAKTFVSSFFPVGDLPLEIVTAWIEEISGAGLYGPDDPLFPATENGLDASGQFAPQGYARRHWSTTAPVRAIFRKAFETAGLPYFYPHSLRRTLMQLGHDLNLTVRELKAWSQSLGHESVLTSLTSYGALRPDEQGEVMAAVTTRRETPDAAMQALARQVAAEIARQAAA